MYLSEVRREEFIYEDQRTWQINRGKTGVKLQGKVENRILSWLEKNKKQREIILKN